MLQAFSQSYYYAMVSAILYFIISSLLVINMLGAHVFKAYPPSFNSLTIPQRTLMLQTTSYVVYIGLGAKVFSAIEGWDYVDGVYWADYTLLTIGLGTDFPLYTNTARGLLIPFALIGITMLGLVIGSIRGLVLERGKTKVIGRTLEKERAKWIDRMDTPSEKWKKKEFEVMRKIEERAEKTRKYSSLVISFVAFLVVWLGGAMVFTYTEVYDLDPNEYSQTESNLFQKPQNWTYFQSLYFAYIALLTIGYGDYYPQSNSGKPFFVIWSLIAVPTVTVLISSMSDTVVGWFSEGTLWLGQRTILPERDTDGKLSMKGPKTVQEAARKEEALEKKQARGGASEDGGSGEAMERLGGAIEMEEEKRGREGSLEARIAREISRLARDVGKKPAKKYGWEEWMKWLELLGEKDDHGVRREAGAETTEREVEWTWLSDEGPLFSRISETEWVLGKLCRRLEQVLEEEVKDAEEGRGDGCSRSAD